MHSRLRSFLLSKTLHVQQTCLIREKMSVDLASLRIKYKDRSETFLEEHLVSKEPIGQFHVWLEEAVNNPKIIEPNAMCLSTCTRDGKPSGRFVLCKGYGKDGFKFFTNLESRKGNELKENPNAALTFYWEVLNRSIRIEGIVKMLSDKESEEYFHVRPVPSQIGAAASDQSRPIASREVLAEKEKYFKISTPKKVYKFLNPIIGEAILWNHILLNFGKAKEIASMIGLDLGVRPKRKFRMEFFYIKAKMDGFMNAYRLK